MHEDELELVGCVIEGKYRIDRVIGAGGFGIVYRGWHAGFERPVAIKCLKVQSMMTEERRRFFETFRSEGRLLHDLSRQHPSIVSVYDIGVTQSPAESEIPYLILEWLNGRDLEAVLRERDEQGVPPYTEQAAVALLRPALEAIAVAHAGPAPVAHRDLKPANLFVPEQGPMKVLDFGIAKVMQESETATRMQKATRSVFRIFSPAYGAPEQFDTQAYGATGPWTDVHALGLILVELVTGRPALDGATQLQWALSSIAATRPTPRARGAGIEVSDAFEAVCQKALALHAVERYRTAGELLKALNRLPRTRTRDEPTVPRVVRGRQRAGWIVGSGLLLIGALSLSAVWTVSNPKSVDGTTRVATPAGERREPATHRPADPASMSQSDGHGPARDGHMFTENGHVELVFIPRGTFTMGTPVGDADSDDDERPEHLVTISSFWLGKYEVTNEEYGRFLDATGQPAPPYFEARDKRPVVHVSWEDANAFAGWAGGRLPTEAEWEYAARGGKIGSQYRALDAIAWHSGNSSWRSHEVGQKLPNAYGLYDVLGNVWEWCSDWFGTYPLGKVTDPSGPATGSGRVGRGGSWHEGAKLVRSAARGWSSPEGRGFDLGFRLARGRTQSAR